jgi:hypothetical protein
VLFQVDTLRQPEGGPGEDSDEDDGGKRRRRKKKKNKKEDKEVQVGDDVNWAQPKLRDRSKWIEDYDKNYPNKELMASAKTIAVKNQILIWQRESPDDKIIGKPSVLEKTNALPSLANETCPKFSSTGPSWPASLVVCSPRKASPFSTTLAT